MFGSEPPAPRKKKLPTPKLKVDEQATVKALKSEMPMLPPPSIPTSDPPPTADKGKAPAKMDAKSALVQAFATAMSNLQKIAKSTASSAAPPANEKATPPSAADLAKQAAISALAARLKTSASSTSSPLNPVLLKTALAALTQNGNKKPTPTSGNVSSAAILQALQNIRSNASSAQHNLGNSLGKNQTRASSGSLSTDNAKALPVLNVSKDAGLGQISSLSVAISETVVATNGKTDNSHDGFIDTEIE